MIFQNLEPDLRFIIFGLAANNYAATEAASHPAITKPSAIIYRYAREFVSAKIDELCAQGSYLRQLDDFPIRES